VKEVPEIIRLGDHTSNLFRSQADKGDRADAGGSSCRDKRGASVFMSGEEGKNTSFFIIIGGSYKERKMRVDTGAALCSGVDISLAG